MKLLTISNTKTVKGEALGYLTGILYLAPASLSGKNLCPHSTPGCRQACLNTAGRGAFNLVQQARLKKTKWLLYDRYSFILQLIKDIQSLKAKAKREGLIPCVRLNGTSDLRWELIAPELFTEFNEVQFYDYTKYPANARKNIPPNYHLTFSASEKTTPNDMHEYLQRGNVTVVVESEKMKAQLLKKKELNAIDGDITDLRFLDPTHNTIVLLSAKGQAKKDRTGFVVR